MVKTYNITLFADYFQVFIYDASLDWSIVRIGADWWTQQDRENMFSLKEDGRLLVMETFRNFTVPIEVVVLGTVPSISSLVEWNHIVECSLRTESSKVLIGELANEGQNGLLIDGDAPNWRLRLYYGGQHTLDKMGVEGEDYYRIELWPTDLAEDARIVKQKAIA